MRAPRLLALSLVGAALVGTAVPASADEAAQQYSAAVALQNQQLYDLAADEWQTFVETHPQHELSQKARYYLGVCHFQQQQYAAAERAFAAVVDQGGRFKLLPSAYLNLGLAQFNQGQQGVTQHSNDAALGRAVATFEINAAQIPDSKDSAEAAFYLAESYYGLEQRDQAIDTYQRTLRKYPRHPRRTELLYGLGVAAEEAKQTDLARDALRQLVELPKSMANRAIITESHVRLADLLLAEGETRQAMAILKQAARDDRSPVADYAGLRLAECYLLAEDFQAAAERFESLVTKYPKSEHRAKAVIGAAKSRFFAEDYASVNRWLRTHQSKLNGPTEYEAAHWQARAHLKLHKPDAAAQLAESALKRLRSASTSVDASTKWRPILEMDFADALFEKTLLEEARSIYTKIAERYPEAEVSPEAAYLAALSSVRQANYRQALSDAESFERRFSDRDPKLATEVTAIRAESLLQLGQHQASARLWKQLLRNYPKQAGSTDWVIRLAVCLQAEGDHAGVVRTIERYPLTDKTLATEANLMLGSAYAEVGRTDEARRILERTLRHTLTHDQQTRAHLMLTSLWRRSGDPRKALAAIKQLTQGGGDTLPASTYLDLADLYYELDEFGRAAESYHRAVQLGQRFKEHDVVAEGRVGMGWSLMETGAAKRAEEAFTRVIAEHPKHETATEALYGRAVALQRQEKCDEAIPLLKQFIERSSDRLAKIDARFTLGVCQAAANEHRAAVATLTKLVRDYPDYESSDQALYELAWSLESLGRDGEASETFQMLAKTFPDSALAGEAAFRVAESKYEAEDFKTAEKYYRVAAERGKGVLRENALHKRGWSYFQRGAYAEAKQAFEQQLQKFSDGPRATEARLMLAECAFQQDEYEQALSSFEAGLRLRPSDQNGNQRLRELAMLHAGQAAGQLGQWRKSLQLLQRAVEQYPESDYAQEATYEQARALQALGKYESAVPLFERVAESTDGLLGARARFMLGELQFLEKDFAAAIRTFFKVAYGYGHPKSPAEFHPWQANAMFEAARCCESTGRVNAAKKLYEDLLEYFPESDKAETARKKLKTVGG